RSRTGNRNLRRDWGPWTSRRSRPQGCGDLSHVILAQLGTRPAGHGRNHAGQRKKEPDRFQERSGRALLLLLPLSIAVLRSAALLIGSARTAMRRGSSAQVPRSLRFSPRRRRSALTTAKERAATQCAGNEAAAKTKRPPGTAREARLRAAAAERMPTASRLPS